MIKTTHSKNFLFLLSIFMGLQSLAQISSIAPNTGNRGQTLPIIISGSSGNFTSQGSGTHFYLAQGSFVIGPGSSTTQGTSTGSFSNVQIVNTSEIHADMNIPMNAPYGQYDVHAYSQNSNYSLPISFKILPGTATGVSMKTGGGKPNSTVNEEFTWIDTDLTGQTITHMWLSKDGTTINTLTNPTVVLKNTDVTVTIQIPASAQTGYWKVNMLTSAGEVYESPSSFLIDATFSIQDHGVDASLINVYPNPFGNELKLSLPSLDNGKLRVIDFNGRVVKELNVEPNTSELKLQMQDVQSGLYLVQVLSNNTIITSRKVVKH